jgi:hypothetical protein
LVPEPSDVFHCEAAMVATAEELQKLVADFKSDAAQFKLDHDKKME